MRLFFFFFFRCLQRTLDSTGYGLEIYGVSTFVLVKTVAALFYLSLLRPGFVVTSVSGVAARPQFYEGIYAISNTKLVSVLSRRRFNTVCCLGARIRVPGVCREEDLLVQPSFLPPLALPTSSVRSR